MKALILVGGYGTRLRPLTLSVPKPLVPFANKPIVLHQIEALAAVGVKVVILAVSHQADQMEAGLRDVSDRLGIKIIVSKEDEPLGTAGPLALARDILTQDNAPFFVFNSDVSCIFPLEELVKFHHNHGGEGSIYVTKVKDPSKYGVVVYEGNGLIQRFVEKPIEFVGDKINAGLYLFNPSILKRIQPVKTSIERETFPQMAADNQLYALELPGFWMDVGQPADYLKGIVLYLNECKEHLDHGPGISGNVLIDPSASIAGDCQIGPNVTIGANVRIGQGVRLKNCAILEGAVVNSFASVSDTIIGWKSVIGKWCHVFGGAVLGEQVKLSEGVLINGCKILPFKEIGNSELSPQILM